MSDHDCMKITADDPSFRRYGLGAAALRYAALGFAVLPLQPRQKRPHPMLGHEGGVHWATTDQRWIRYWWSQDRAAGIGVACGPVSGLVVVDLDVKGDANGMDVLSQRMEALQEGWVGEPPLVATPSGGRHVWLRLPTGVDVPQRNSMLPAVDVKSGGGYVAAPPTHIDVHPLARPGESGGPVLLPYRWLRGCPCQLPIVPGWLRDLAYTAPESIGASGEGGSWSRVDVTDMIEHGLARGERNSRLYQLACSAYRRYGTTPNGCSAARREIDWVLARTDRAGFGDGEVRTIMASALRWAREREAERDRQAAAALQMIRHSW